MADGRRPGRRRAAAMLVLALVLIVAGEAGVLPAARAQETPEEAARLSGRVVELYQQGKYEEAIPLSERAVAIRKRRLGEQSPDYALSLIYLGLLYYKTGRYEKAEPLYLQATEIRKRARGAEHPEYAADLINLAILYQVTGRGGEALDLLTRGMQIQQHNLERVFSASSEAAMRDLLASISNWLDGLLSMAAAQKSPAATEAALTAALQRKAVILDTLVRFRRAQLLAASDPEVAEQVARLRSLRQRLSDLPLRRPAGIGDEEFRRRMAQLRSESDQIEADLNRRLAAQRQEQPAGDVDVASVRRRLPAGAALVEYVRAEIFDFKATGKEPLWKPAEYFAIVLTGSDPQPRMIPLGKAAAIDDAVSRVRQHIARSRDYIKGSTEKEVHEAEQDYEEDYRKLNKDLDLYGLVFGKVRKELPVSTELIYLVPDGQLSLLPFEALVDENNKYLIEHYRFAYLSSGRDLLRASTAGTGKGTVVFADPNYELRAAEREKTAKLLLAALDKPSAAEMSFIAADLNQSGAPYSGALSIDVRSGALRWDKLKGSAAEARDVSEQLAAIAYGPVKPYLRDEALEEVFKRVRSPRVLHVSTHGFFLEGETEAPQERQAPLELENAAVVGRELLRRASGENPLLRSGLVLAGANELKDLAEASTPEKGAGEQSKVDDGWLTAEEVALMDLRGTELVVLSACETGQGDVRNGEGVYGLRRAFQLAGAQTIVMTLFKVPDAQSAQIMKGFYEGLKAQEGKLKALHEAQLEVIRKRREEGGAAHPFFWAGFVLAGDPN